MTGRYGSEYGRRINHRETIPFTHPITPQARPARCPPQRIRLHDYIAYLTFARRSRLWRAPASFVQLIAAGRLVDLALLTP
jgi:hypothetical protein